MLFKCNVYHLCKSLKCCFSLLVQLLDRFTIHVSLLSSKRAEWVCKGVTMPTNIFVV